MSMITTGINIPINCVECNENGIQNLLDCDLIFSGCANCGRHPKCPLKSVDGLIERLNRAGADNDKSVYKNLHPSYVRGLKDAVKIIKEYCGMEGE